jgi:hypothetical protein
VLGLLEKSIDVKLAGFFLANSSVPGYNFKNNVGYGSSFLRSDGLMSDGLKQLTCHSRSTKKDDISSSAFM